LANGEGEQKNKRKQKAEREVGIICSTKAILSEKVDLKRPLFSMLTKAASSEEANDCDSRIYLS
jgi:hypothetical protein